VNNLTEETKETKVYTQPINLSIGAIEDINAMMKFNDEIVKFQQQLQQFQMAYNEAKRIKEDIKNKKITKILVPTLGNNLVQINPSGEEYQRMINENMKQFDNSIQGIEGQIMHREDGFYESMMRVYKHIGNHLVYRGLELPEIKKPEVKK
jgi:hypothetical protein